MAHAPGGTLTVRVATVNVNGPAIVKRPIALVVPSSPNQMLLSGPSARPRGELPAGRPSVDSVIEPLGVMRPSAPALSLNQTLPSGPGATSAGALPAFSPWLNSVIVPLVVMRPIALVVPMSLNHRF